MNVINPTTDPRRCGVHGEVHEVNPDFRVLTFEDHACEQVYVDPI